MYTVLNGRGHIFFIFIAFSFCLDACPENSWTAEIVMKAKQNDERTDKFSKINDVFAIPHYA